MKYLCLALMFSSTSLYAFSLQLGLGGLTPHFVTKKKNYCNQWNNTGIIANKSTYVRLGIQKVGFSYLRGDDSICSEIEGIFLHYIFNQTKWIETGVTVGGYSFNQKNWDIYKEKTPSGISAPEPVQIDYFGREVVPIVALDIAIHLIRQDQWSLKLNNLFTPIIFNHSLAFEYRF